MHGFIHAQPFCIGPIEYGRSLSWHLPRIVERYELHVLRLGCWLGLVDEFAQRVAYPRDHHRPSFHTAMMVDAIFESVQPHQRVDIKGLLFGNSAFDGERPWMCLEVLG